MRSTSNAFILHLLHLTIEWFNTDVNYMRVTVMIPQKTEDTKADFPTVSKKSEESDIKILNLNNFTRKSKFTYKHQRLKLNKK